MSDFCCKAGGEAKPNPCPWHDVEPKGYWAISAADLLSLMKRAHAGEDPHILYAEAFANSSVEGQ